MPRPQPSRRRIEGEIPDVPQPARRRVVAASGAGVQPVRRRLLECIRRFGQFWPYGSRSLVVPLLPDLTKAATDWRPNEVYWIVKHGIKITAMPAFGDPHGAKTLWNIAGFVEQLPTMTPERYAAVPGDHGDASDTSESDHTRHTH